MEIQLSMFDVVMDLVRIEPILLLGIAIIAIFVSKGKTAILSVVLYYYLCVMLINIVGIPTLAEYIRLTQLDEAFFNPNINLILLREGLSTGFILNIFLFIPLGFLCPLISRTFERAGNTFFIGLGLSAMIEIGQLFTLYRATDINDLIANTLGTLIGYLCFRLAAKLRIVKTDSNQTSAKIPFAIIGLALVLGFFS
ncbi:MAG: VanZ family protein [Clostridia bacterium]|nr:VanZ family protein [Lachnospiraceae bacterium]NCC01322.1 VanZ family protein [Clostridia bacterium]NCD03194.1 VanZ family protein [Clostridia bacterium]